MLDDTEVHQTHCCSRHGCKYGDEECPVVLGTITQEYPCEYCREEEEGNKEFKKLLTRWLEKACHFESQLKYPGQDHELNQRQADAFWICRSELQCVLEGRIVPEGKWDLAEERSFQYFVD
jgi:hypothetical protein